MPSRTRSRTLAAQRAVVGRAPPPPTRARPRIRCTGPSGSAAVEERFAREPVVRALVVRRHAALVAPPELRRPTSRARRSAASSYARRGVEPPASARWPPRARSSERRDGLARPPPRRRRPAARRSKGLALTRAGGELARAVHRGLDRVQERRAHAGALELADRAIVVPPGDVTISRSSTGCIFSSRSCFAVPSIVWTTSRVEISRESAEQDARPRSSPRPAARSTPAPSRRRR